jgi:hypothetical protein
MTWIEGVGGYAIGESLTINFPPDHASISKLVFVNRWVRSKELWDAFSRPKSLEMIVNGKAFSILNFAKTKQELTISSEAGDWTDFKGTNVGQHFRILNRHRVFYQLLYNG